MDYRLLMVVALCMAYAPAAPATKHKECDFTKADIGFLLDESTSIYPEDFQRLKDWVKALAASFKIGVNDTRVGALAWSSDARFLWDLSAYGSSREVNASVDAITQTHGDTYTDKALAMLRSRLFTEANRRQGVPRIAFVITDGGSTIPWNTAAEAEKVKEMTNLFVFAIGIGSAITLSELQTIGSKPSSEFVYQVSSFEGLGTIKAKLANMVCQIQEQEATALPPTDGWWREWSSWTTCSVNCGGGWHNRSRVCVPPINGGMNCRGESRDQGRCNTQGCASHGVMSAWGAWGSCSAQCGGGTQARSRTCTPPQNGGRPCEGALSMTQVCNTQGCAVDGQWNSWGSWSTCSAECGGGTEKRTRTCSPPQHGGQDCQGSWFEMQTCNTQGCPQNGRWSAWSEWGYCTARCGGGTQARIRFCTQPVNGGKPCEGSARETQECNKQGCPVDGYWKVWTAWGECTAECGGGTQDRSRECVPPKNDGRPCQGDRTMTQPCHTHECAVHGEWYDWSAWGACSASCDGGRKERNRQCREPKFGGRPCEGSSIERTTCNTQGCVVDGRWGAWSDWTYCTARCGGGTQDRTRHCIPPLNGGALCQGSPTESQQCNKHECPVDGKWLLWSSWGDCSVACGGGTQSRQRKCELPRNDGRPCQGDRTMTQPCNEHQCPISGQWRAWGAWGTCTETCGGGTKERNRECQEPQFGGRPCEGSSVERTSCNTQGCPVDGRWSAWSTWTFCTVRCGGGTQNRNRACSDPLNGGAPCQGPDRERQACNVFECPVDGYWENWADWKACTVTCGGGTQQRTRNCVPPRNDGRPCQGEPEMTQPCNLQLCPVDGLWSGWSNWGGCSASCGGGRQARFRSCKPPENGGRVCEGSARDEQTCNPQGCPADGWWKEWGEWGSCTVQCGGGTQERMRECMPAQNGGLPCLGLNRDRQPCNIEACPVNGEWRPWATWSACSVSCGDGNRRRARTCIPAQNGGRPCQGDNLQTETCPDPKPCPENGHWNEWESWGSCSAGCGGGIQERTRQCTPPRFGGLDCIGQSTAQQICNPEPCSVDGSWQDWGEWGTCSVTCGGGNRERKRICRPPQHGGAQCVGPATQSETCNQQGCPVNGRWSDWEDWGTCTVSCGGGRQQRSRTCTEPQNGGLPCSGSPQESRTCNLDPCPVPGRWKVWSDWGACTVTCGGGEQLRRRMCDHPQFGGVPCQGLSMERKECATQACPVNGRWKPWSTWTGCSATCGGGSRQRMRMCMAPQNGGTPCNGKRREVEECNKSACPEDGHWNAWGSWAACSAQCGGGIQGRTRQCSPPRFGGLDCIGLNRTRQPCNTKPCSVDGELLLWSSWGSCSVSCGGGDRARLRVCIPPQYGGKACQGPTRETAKCNPQGCPENGRWTDWGDWGSCSSQCGGGIQERKRECREPQNGGLPCSGSPTESRSCNHDPCPVHGMWKDWTEWGTCTLSCGGGEQLRRRECRHPKFGGSPCQGTSMERRECGKQACPEDGKWSSWGEFTACSVECGGGTQRRERKCDPPQHGGKPCSGSGVDIRTCNTHNCPVPGYWQAWQPWEECSLTCGGGIQHRMRTCSTPQYGGRDCSGERVETRRCNTDGCPVDGRMSLWGAWQACSATCGGGTRVRMRTCSPPENGGRSCSGDMSETEYCNENVPCPVNGHWGFWGSWDACTATCGGGVRKRTRACIPPQHGGSPCTGMRLKQEQCNTDVNCPEDGQWMTWNSWSACSASCGRGQQRRSRGCTAPRHGGAHCDERLSTETRACNAQRPCAVHGTWAQWGSWGGCSASCSGGIQQRFRSCNPPQNGGRGCQGSKTDERGCNTQTPCRDVEPQRNEACTSFPVDVIFGVSDQANMYQTAIAIDFFKSVVGGLAISALHVQGGMIPRYCMMMDQVRLMDNEDQKSLMEDLECHKLKGLTPAHQIAYLYQTAFRSANGGRAGAARIGVLIVDYDNYDMKHAMEVATEAKQIMQLIVIGVGPRVTRSQLKGLATSDGHVFIVETYAQLPTIRAAVIARLCLRGAYVVSPVIIG